MWFQFPKGAESISVQQQQFSIEASDEEGRGYFRAPDHFAGLILDVPGFSAKEPPNTDLPDLPKADPLRDGAIGDLGRKLDASQTETRELREDLNRVSAELRAMADENRALKTAMAILEKDNSDLKERLDEFEDEKTTREALLKKGAIKPSDEIKKS